MIRRLRPSDHEAVAKLWHDSWHLAHAGLVSPALLPHRTLAAFASRVPSSLLPHCLVAARDALEGFACVAGDEVTQFFVAPAALGTGVAQLLLRASEELLHAEGVRTARSARRFGGDPGRRLRAEPPRALWPAAPHG